MDVGLKNAGGEGKVFSSGSLPGKAGSIPAPATNCDSGVQQCNFGRTHWTFPHHMVTPEGAPRTAIGDKKQEPV